MRKINEIFYSLQGEGAHAGTPSIFIRFSGCNLRCAFCDTRHEEGTWMTDEEILGSISPYPTPHVILTGGEPALSIDKELIDLLHKAGKHVSIETNGTRSLPQGIDWITCSPKEGAPVVLPRADEIKVVYVEQDVERYRKIPASLYFLQPCSRKNTHEVIDYILTHPWWRLSLQTHKYIDIP